MPTPEQEIDRLFGLPLSEFTAARNELARRLKSEGKTDAADQVRALSKPSAAVWAINQLARREKQAVRSLLTAGAALRKAQERALARAGGADALRAAQTKHHGEVRALTRRAREILEADGRPVTRDVLDRLERTLGAAAVDEHARALLKAGRLTDELESPSFDTLLTLQVPARPAGSTRRETVENRRREEERRQQRRRLELAARQAEQRAREAVRDADDAERAATRARKLAEDAQRAAAKAAAELSAL